MQAELPPQCATEDQKGLSDRGLFCRRAVRWDIRYSHPTTIVECRFDIFSFGIFTFAAASTRAAPGSE
jgi:hypothetical protein